LWVVSGGSNINVAVDVSKNLKNNDLMNLTVILSDERFGQVGHGDSNWAQLLRAGFKLPSSNTIEVLGGLSRPKTIEAYKLNLQNAIQRSDYAIGLFGIGVDGHTAGILPGSIAARRDCFCAAYDAAPYFRITMGPAAILMLNEVVVYAMGRSKTKALKILETEIPIAIQPAQILKKVSKLTIFSDILKEYK
jgi:6-phosphogluconolactonase/glucosamine-6-phosphate isomerase/deaminase